MACCLGMFRPRLDGLEGALGVPMICRMDYQGVCAGIMAVFGGGKSPEAEDGDIRGTRVRAQEGDALLQAY